MVGPTARSRELARWLLLGLAGAILVVHSLAYNFVTDDAYISFVYSRNFAEHGQLVFNLGDAVEGYTNFSWTVLLGILMKVGIAPEISSRILGTVCALGSLAIVTRTVERALGRPSPWAAVPALLLACSSGFACWTSGGLETQLFTLLVVAAIDGVVAAVERPAALRRAAICLALAAMTRPEGPLVAAVLGVVWVVHRVLARRASVPEARVHVGDPSPLVLPLGLGLAVVGASAMTAAIRGSVDGLAVWGALLALVASGVLLVRRPPRRFGTEYVAAVWFLGLWLPWFLWRWWYYGWPFPNTYYVKASGPWTNPAYAKTMLDNGFYYVWVWLAQTKLLIASPLIALALIAIRPRTPRFVLVASCGLLLAVYLAYTITVGGDFMGLHRFIMPVFACAAILVVLGVEVTTRWLPTERVVFPGSLMTIAYAIVLAVAIGVLAIVEWPRWWPGLGVLALAGGGLAVGGITRRGLAVAAVAVVVGTFAISQLDLTRRSLDPTNLDADHGVIDTPAFLIVYTEDRAKIGRAMESCFRDDDFSIVGGAGAQPYFARMRGIDVFGLVSDKIAHREPRSRPRAGHTKWGNDALLAEYAPDFVFSCYAIHHTPAQPSLPCAGPWLRRGFELVTIAVPGLAELSQRAAKAHRPGPPSEVEYYTFLASKARRFECPGRVH